MPGLPWEYAVAKRKVMTTKNQTGLREERWAWLFLVAALLLVAFIRIHLMPLPLERDEGEYAYAGQLLLQGIPPYVLAYNMKLPGIYAAYAAIMAIFGQSPSGIHFGLLLVSSATSILLFLLTKRLFGALAGAIAGAAYAILAVSPSVMGIYAHATHFIVLPAVAGLLLLCKALDSRKSSLFWWSGLLSGVSVLMKQHAFFVAMFGAFYLLWELRARGVALKDQRPLVGRYALGLALPFAATCLILTAVGVFPRFWFWTFSYAREYVTHTPASVGWQRLRENTADAMGPNVWVWVIAAIGATAAFWDAKARKHRAFLFGFLLFSALAVAPGMHFRDHYYIVILPSVSLLAGVGVSSARDRLKRAAIPAVCSLAPVLLVSAALAYPIVVTGPVLFNPSMTEVSRATCGPNPFPEAVKIAEYIRSHTSESDRIAVIGSEPEIYFYAHRHSATGYIYMYPLMEPQKYAPQMQKELIQEVVKAKPKYLVFVNIKLSWLEMKGSKNTIFKWMIAYAPREYRPVGIADMLPNRTNYVWGDDTIGYTSRSDMLVWALERKDSVER
jgi:hypothetical protein